MLLTSFVLVSTSLVLVLTPLVLVLTSLVLVLTSLALVFQFVVKGSLEGGGAGTLALDDITLTNGPCSTAFIIG